MRVQSEKNFLFAMKFEYRDGFDGTAQHLFSILGEFDLCPEEIAYSSVVRAQAEPIVASVLEDEFEPSELPRDRFAGLAAGLCDLFQKVEVVAGSENIDARCEVTVRLHRETADYLRQQITGTSLS